MPESAEQGSGAPPRSTPDAARLARLTGEELHAISVWDYPAGIGWGSVVLEDIDWSESPRKDLDDAVTASLHPDEADRLQRSVVRGYPAGALLDAAAEADLLVVGSRGRGGMVGMLLGSVSQHVVTNARCPVVVRAEPSTPA